MMGPREMLLPCGKRLLLMPGREGALRGPVIFWPMSEEHGRPIAEAAAYICGQVREMTRESDAFVLAALSVEDWNGELSPWKAEIPEMGQQFSGGGPETLRKIRAEAMPAILQMLDAQDPAGKAAPLWMIAGYSLAGLFALWALEQERGAGAPEQHWSGAAGCSSSMWFPGWLDYAKERTASRVKVRAEEQSEESAKVQVQDAGEPGGPDTTAVYLSLGGKEHKTAQPFIAGILDATREYERLLGEDPAVAKHVLEMNKGGHFADPDGRVAKGIAWLLKNVKCPNG